MTAISLTFDDAQLKRALNELQDAIGDMTPVMREIGVDLQNEIRQCLRNSETPWGEPFEPLKSRNGNPLMDTTQHIFNRIDFDHDRNSVAVGMNENVNIGATHQFGATIKPVRAKRLRFTMHGKPVYAKQVTIPARPFLPIRNNQVDLPPDWEQKILDRIKKALDKAVRR